MNEYVLNLPTDTIANTFGKNYYASKRIHSSASGGNLEWVEYIEYAQIYTIAEAANARLLCKLSGLKIVPLERIKKEILLGLRDN